MFATSRAARCAVLAVAVALLLALPASGEGGTGGATALAQTAGPDELKAAFLYNFGKFVVWPAASLPPEEVFVIGVLGDDSIEEALRRTVRDKPMHARRIVIRQLRSVEDARACQVLFVSATERAQLPRILESLQGARVLTVSDMDQFVDRGGMIRLVLDGGRYGFEINLHRVERAGLKMSSQLLKLARRVIEPAPGSSR
jgi:hypothetical protein